MGLERRRPQKREISKSLVKSNVFGKVLKDLWEFIILEANLNKDLSTLNDLMKT